MRIITGIYKGRRFDIPHSFKARPTTDFAKENIFNVLNAYIDLEGTRALDLFAGTGSISLELLSRGCEQVVSVEADRDHARFISECVRKLGVTNHQLIRGDVFRYLKSAQKSLNPVSNSSTIVSGSLPMGEGRGGASLHAAQQPDRDQRAFDFIFADPPYSLPNLPDIPQLVLQSGLLAPGGIFVFEHGKQNDFSSHPCFREHRAYGSVNFSIFTT